MNSERIKEIQAETAYPQSRSVHQALLKVWNECEQKQERSYSEEDIINALHSVELKDNKDYSKIFNGMKEWFEKSKKIKKNK